MEKMLKNEYKSLTIAERILLAEEIWDSIEVDSPIKLSVLQKKLLDDRESDALSGKVSKESWEEIKKSIIAEQK